MLKFFVSFIFLEGLPRPGCASENGFDLLSFSEIGQNSESTESNFYSAADFASDDFQNGPVEKISKMGIHEGYGPDDWVLTNNDGSDFSDVKTRFDNELSHSEKAISSSEVQGTPPLFE